MTTFLAPVASATPADLSYTRDGRIALGSVTIGTVQPGETRAAAGRRALTAARKVQTEFDRWSAAVMPRRRVVCCEQHAD
jgi:hypothetical protein